MRGRGKDHPGSVYNEPEAVGSNSMCYGEDSVLS